MTRSLCRIPLVFLTLLISQMWAYAYDTVRYPIIPKPAQLIAGSGVFKITPQTKIVVDNQHEAFKKTTAVLIRQVQETAGFRLGYAKDQKLNSISFLLDPAISNEEGYTLVINPSHIVVRYKAPVGIFWAIQTLRQLIPATEKKGVKSISLPAVKITDAPRFKYRGVLLDVARYYFPMDFIKKYIDVLSLYKINKFHIHLNDDQGWRMESKKYPKLHEIGAWRKETLVGHRTDVPEKFDGKPHGGYYTQKELKELVQYAQDRFVTIVPEIDVPGHSQAILAAYPQYGCLEDTTYQVSARWGVHNNILCPTADTFRFLEGVLTEVMEIFPGKYIHIGGDEVPKDRWKASAFCQDLIRKQDLKDEHGLQSYFISRVEQFLNSKGRAIIGWDEILEGGLAPNATVMSWRNEKGGIAAAKLKHEVIMTPSNYTYINMYQTRERNQEPFSNGGFTPLSKIYAYDPVPETLHAEEQKYIIGTQACLWTEYIPTPAIAEFMSFPRALALAEVGWTPVSHKNYEDFVKRLRINLPHLEKKKVNFSRLF